MPAGDFDTGLRTAAFDFFEARHDLLITYEDVRHFHYAGHHVPLMDRQRGIRKPAILDAALSLRTTYTPPGQVPPYLDSEGPDGLLRYKYRGDDPQHPENVALRRAFQQGVPLIWFFGVAPGLYLPRYPVWLVADEPEQLQFAVAVDEGQRFIRPGEDLTENQRRYVEQLTRRRLHQPVFRARVLQAYEGRCSLCALRHVELLDAAHIIADGLPGGDPIVPNGLSMCKIHHAAYDRNILGVSPDLKVKIRGDILAEIDGPMLRHGLQELDGTAVRVLPKPQAARPDRERLAQRYGEFLAAS